jgi:prolyl-tRNA synthetase
VSHRSLPLRLYQITSKFRDELRPKFGLLRAKEFLMKDMYAFDVDLARARETYDAVSEQYVKIFNQLDLPFVCIAADTGNMGGKVSHEYHLITPIGEDSIITCKKCSKSINKEISEKICEKCEDLTLQQGIEIAHTFILEDRYSKQLKATYLSKGKPEVIQMGCYGIGITRLIAASIEVLSSENEIRWPIGISPFKVCLITPKEGSIFADAVTERLEKEIIYNLTQHLGDDVAVDDRGSMTIGKRLLEMKKLGIPFILVIGSKACDENPTIEVHNLARNEISHLSVSEALNYVLKCCN